MVELDRLLLDSCEEESVRRAWDKMHSPPHYPGSVSWHLRHPGPDTSLWGGEVITDPSSEALSLKSSYMCLLGVHCDLIFFYTFSMGCVIHSCGSSFNTQLSIRGCSAWNNPTIGHFPDLLSINDVHHPSFLLVAITKDLRPCVLNNRN